MATTEKKVVQSTRIQDVARPLETTGFRAQLKKTCDKYVASSRFERAAAWMEEYAQFVDGPRIIYAQLEAGTLIYKCTEEEALLRISEIQMPTHSNVPKNVLVKMVAIRLRDIEKLRIDRNEKVAGYHARNVKSISDQNAERLLNGQPLLPAPVEPIPLPSGPEDMDLQAFDLWVDKLCGNDNYYFRKPLKEIRQLFVQKPGSDAPDVIQAGWNMVMANSVVSE